MGASGRKPPAKNGGKTAGNGSRRGRDALGRFMAGNRGGGRPKNPYGRRCAALRAAFAEAISVGDVKRVARKLVALAELGDPTSLRLFVALLGPLAPVNPDLVSADELEVRRATPKPVDWMLMELEEDRFTGSAGDPAGALAEDLDEEDLDEDPAADDAPEPAPDPDDPLTGWEQFAAARLEWGEAWGTPFDLLFGSYSRWSLAYGQPLLADSDVLTWLQARGARVTGSGASGRWVQGLRVVD
jgi:hypothetical protein